jgi:glycosyltransferase involved in cell wall biosynthesis
MPLVSICIPAYNRANVLPSLLESALEQSNQDFDVCICENASPEREAIRSVVSNYRDAFGGRLHYFENERNLGYDANLRKTIDNATGEFCLLMGNDDLLYDSAIASVAKEYKADARLGVVLRSYDSFDGSPKNVVESFRYFPTDRHFLPGLETIATFFRRSVVISGLTIRRSNALLHRTDRHDGTLLYQLHLVGRILATATGAYINQPMVLYRNGGVPDFGSSDTENQSYTPRHRTVDSSLAFVKGFLEIAKALDHELVPGVYEKIALDLSRYSLPIIATHSDKPMHEFLRYINELKHLGLGCSPYFYLYSSAIALFGSRQIDRMVRVVKKTYGSTPLIGRVYSGEEGHNGALR